MNWQNFISAALRNRLGGGRLADCRLRCLNGQSRPCCPRPPSIGFVVGWCRLLDGVHLCRLGIHVQKDMSSSPLNKALYISNVGMFWNVRSLHLTVARHAIQPLLVNSSTFVCFPSKKGEAMHTIPVSWTVVLPVVTVFDATLLSNHREMTQRGEKLAYYKVINWGGPL